MNGFATAMPANAPHIRMSLFIFIGFVWFCVVVSVLNSCHLFSFFPLAAVADILGEGDEVMVGPVASSFLTKKALMLLNSAARELSGRTLAPEAFTSIVWRRVPDLSVSQAVPMEYILALSFIVLSAESTMPFWMGFVLTANVRLTPSDVRNDFSFTGRRSLPSPSMAASSGAIDSTAP